MTTTTNTRYTPFSVRLPAYEFVREFYPASSWDADLETLKYPLGPLLNSSFKHHPCKHPNGCLFGEFCQFYHAKEERDFFEQFTHHHAFKIWQYEAPLSPTTASLTASSTASASVSPLTASGSASPSTTKSKFKPMFYPDQLSKRDELPSTITAFYTDLVLDLKIKKQNKGLFYYDTYLPPIPRGIRKLIVKTSRNERNRNQRPSQKLIHTWRIISSIKQTIRNKKIDGF